MSKKHRLSRNLVSLAGLLIVSIALAIGVVLLVAQEVVGGNNPYSSIVTFFGVPAVITFGAAIFVLGVLLERRRRKKNASDLNLPILDFNSPRVRRVLVGAAFATAIFASVSGVALYQAFHYTESTEFCGTTCHNVMGAEFAAYQHSPHSRVSCVECHIGEGAEWYVRSKLSGLRQVVRTIMDSYERPIPTPVHDLRPARETCEQCHWPSMFHGSHERRIYSVWYDEENTPSRYLMLMNTGGPSPQTGHYEGIHWHTSGAETVRYWAADEQRLDIPWVEFVDAEGNVTVYRDTDAPEQRPPDAEFRNMDCIDCHNRPSHVYRRPSRVLNEALVGGRISRDLPGIKAAASAAMEATYENTEAARAGIRTALLTNYEGSGVDQAALEQAIDVSISIYEETTFPEHHVDWTTYPDHIGHMYSPGCFRCHNDRHTTTEGRVISMECNNCHTFVSQSHGEAALADAVYQAGPFQHPEGIEDMHEGMQCVECHAPRREAEE
jgi:hypothetical protein